MATRQLINPVENKSIVCPKCKTKMLITEGTFVKWLICPNSNCKYKKLEEVKKDNKPQITEV